MSASTLRLLLNAALAVVLLGSVLVFAGAVTGQFDASHWSVVTDRPAERSLVLSASGAGAGALYLSRGAMIVHAGIGIHILQLANLAVLLVVAILVLLMLRRIAGSIAEGRPFGEANVARLRRVGWLLIGASLWSVAHAAVSQSLLVGSVALADGARLLPAISGGTVTGETIRLAFEFQPGWLIGGLIALALAEAFRIGAEYRQDSEEVI